MDDLPKPPRKKLHEYKVPFTDEQVAMASQLLSEGMSIRAISIKMDMTWPRTKTLVNRLEVMEAAHKLRMTSLVPDQLQAITHLLSQAITALEVVENRQSQLEAQMRKMTRTMWNKNILIHKKTETIKELRKRERDLRNLIRSRGIV